MKASESSNTVRHACTSAPSFFPIYKITDLSDNEVRAVLNETLRLFPPVPLNVRESRPAAVALPSSHLPSYTSKFGYPHTYVATPKEPLLMPGSTPIMYMPMLMQRNPDLWGPDADKFDPDRFLDPQRAAMLTSNPFMFIPFSAGPRIVGPFCTSISCTARNLSHSFSASDRTLRTTRLHFSSFAFSSNSTRSHLHRSSSRRDRFRLPAGRRSRVVNLLSDVGPMPR